MVVIVGGEWRNFCRPGWFGMILFAPFVVLPPLTPPIHSSYSQTLETAKTNGLLKLTTAAENPRLDERTVTPT